MKGQQLSELLTDIDTDLVTDAMPPDWRTGKVGKVKKAEKTKKERRFLRSLGDMMDSGWAAAILSVIVAVGVLTAIVMAGRMGARDPAVQDPNAPGNAPGFTPGGQVGDGLGQPDMDKAEGEAPGLDLPEAPLDGIMPEESAPVYLPPELSIKDVELWMHLNGMLLSDNMVAIYSKGYVVGKGMSDLAAGIDSMESIEAFKLSEIAETLKNNAYFVSAGLQEISFSGGEGGKSVVGISVYDADCQLLREVDTYDMNASLLRELELLGGMSDGLYLVVHAQTRNVTETRIESTLYDYPLYVRFKSQSNQPDLTLRPIEVAGELSADVHWDAEAVDKALYGGVNPDNADDMSAFVELYAPDVTPEDAAVMIRLMRALPAPLPSYPKMFPTAICGAGSKNVVYCYTIDGLHYQFTLFGDVDDAIAIVTELPPLVGASEKAMEDTVLLSIAIDTDENLGLWGNMKEALVYVAVSAPDGGLGNKSHDELLSRFYVHGPSAQVGGESSDLPETEGSVEEGTGIPEFGYVLAEDGKSYILTDVVYTPNSAVNPVNEFAIPVNVNELTVSALADYVFEGIEVHYLYIPLSVTEIGYAFAGCTELEGIYFDGRAKDWEAIPKPEGWRDNTRLMWVDCADEWIFLGEEEN